MSDIKVDGWTISPGAESRSWDIMATRVRDEVTVLLETHIGERCPDVVEGCPICDRWALLDKLLESPYEEPTQ